MRHHAGLVRRQGRLPLAWTLGFFAPISVMAISGMKPATVAADTPPLGRFDSETRGCFLGLQAIAEAIGPRLFVLPIPAKEKFCKKLELVEVADLSIEFNFIPLDAHIDAYYTAALEYHFNDARHVLVKDVLRQIFLFEAPWVGSFKSKREGGRGKA